MLTGPKIVIKKSPLSGDQIEAYKQAGYLAFREPVLTPAQFRKLKTYWDERAGPSGIPLRLQIQPHLSDPAIFEWIFADAILDLVEPLIGSDVSFFFSQLLYKPPHGTMPPRWHKDCVYWRGLLMTPLNFCVIALSLEPSHQKNGCLLVVPGTHRFRHRDDTRAPSDLDDKVMNRFCEPRAVPVELDANEASLQHGCLIHGGGPNLSRAPRRSLYLFYMNAQTRLHRTAQSEFYPPYLARGRGFSENRYADPRRTYPELALRTEAHFKDKLVQAALLNNFAGF